MDLLPLHVGLQKAALTAIMIVVPFVTQTARQQDELHHECEGDDEDDGCVTNMGVQPTTSDATRDSARPARLVTTHEYTVTVIVA